MIILYDYKIKYVRYQVNTTKHNIDNKSLKPFNGQLTKFSQLYKNSHKSKFPIEKLLINTQTNPEKST